MQHVITKFKPCLQSVKWVNGQGGHSPSVWSHDPGVHARPLHSQGHKAKSFFSPAMQDGVGTAATSADEYLHSAVIFIILLVSCCLQIPNTSLQSMAKVFL